MLQNTADPMPCPTPILANYARSRRSTAAHRRCAQGGAGYNSFNGQGQINALTAVS